MSKLDELLQELCPDGVEYISLDQCTEKVDNIKWKNVIGTYQYIDLTSVDRDTHRIAETQAINASNAPSRAQQIVKAGDILLGATRPMLKRYCMIDMRFDGQICSTGFCVLRTNDELVLNRWLYHNISSTNFFDHVEKYQKGASYPAIADADVKMYKIPVPPLEVQREIVRILDNFTETTQKLEEQLRAELTARQKQYEYYRDKLLTFDVRGGGTSDVVWRTVSEIAQTYIGLATSVTRHKTQSGVLLLHNSDIQQNQIVLKKVEYISEEFAKKNEGKRFQLDDIITVHTGDVGTSAVITADYVGTIGFTTITTRINDKNMIRPKYLCHYLNSNLCKRDIASMTISDRSNLNQKSFDKLMIPIPTLAVQDKIVHVLDNFDAICSDLSIGLPAEIEARQKQYEFYRDKLLTFERLKY